MFCYGYMVAEEDVRTQQNGIISVIFAVGDSIRRPLDSGTFLQVPKLLKAIPSLIRGIHFCYEDEFIVNVYPNPIKIIQLAVDTLTRTKLRVHHGKFKHVKKKQEPKECLLIRHNIRTPT